MKFLRFGQGDEHALKCQEARKNLSELLEETPLLTPDLLHHIQRHLEACPPCGAFMDTLKATVRTLQSMPAQEVPETLRRALRAQAEDHRP